MTETTAIAERPEGTPAQSESTALIAMIERAALNPDIDMAKMERLLDMQDRILGRQAKAAFDADFAQMQPRLPSIVERGKIEKRSTYALWEDINDAIKPILMEFGFSLRFKSEQPDGKVVITATLAHVGGHSEMTTITLPHDPSGGKNPVQAIGSAISYGKRYAAGELLNLTSRGEDDDGRAAGGAEKISDEQRDKLLALLAEADADVPEFCEYAKIDAVANLPANRFDWAVKGIEKRKAALAAKANANG